MRLPSHSGPYSEVVEYYSSLDIQILTEATHTQCTIQLHWITHIYSTYVTMRATNVTSYYLWQWGPPRNSLTMTGSGVVSTRSSSHWAPETVNHTHSTGIAETACVPYVCNIITNVKCTYCTYTCMYVRTCIRTYILHYTM